MDYRSFAFALVIVTPTIGCQCAPSKSPDTVEIGHSVVIPASTEIDAAVANLIEIKTDGTGADEFLGSLDALANKRGWQQELADCKKLMPWFWQGRAFSLQTEQRQYVVILLESTPPVIPWIDVRTVILLDNEGKHLDHLSCEISNRLTLDGSGEFHTVVLDKAEADGALLVIRLDGESTHDNFAHHIYHAGEDAKFHWGQSDEAIPTKWDVKGLCRIAIRDGKFEVVFPQDKNTR